MGEVFLWAVIYLATMLLGYVLKRLGVFKKEDRKFLSDVIFYITLPAMLVSSFTGVTVDLWFLIAMPLGFGTNALMVVRYSCAALAALVIWFLIPAPLLMRKVLALSVFSASPNVALIYSTRLGIRTDIVSALAPLTTLMMIPLMSTLMILMG